jgi:hypothetical protein
MSTNKLFVHGFRSSIPMEDRKAMIINLFSQYGNIKMIPDPRTGEDKEAISFIPDKERGGDALKNFCFVEMEDSESAEAVVANCDGAEFDRGIKISVSLAQDKSRA